MTALADAVLPLIRTLAELHRWSASNEHGGRMHEGVDALESALPTADPADVHAVTQKPWRRRSPSSHAPMTPAAHRTCPKSTTGPQGC